MIDVIIPAFNAHDTIEKTLASIAYQDNVKQLKVYIVNDASNNDYSKEVNFFSNFMDIKEITLSKNSGPGVARQYGIDHSKSEYIVFIDSDDKFYSPYALTTLYNSIEESGADVVISNFYEILADGSKIEHEEDTIWVHGKIYRRDFLKDNNIKFNDTRANEDNGFNQLVLLHDSNIEYIDDFTYLWDYNENSITRINDHEYQFGGIEGYIYNITWALNIAIKNNCDYNKIAEQVFSNLLAVYYYYIQFFNEENVDILIKKSKRLYEIYLDYQLEEEEKLEKWNEQYMYSTENLEVIDKLNPPISFEEFLKKIEHYNNRKDMVIALCCTETWYEHLIISLYSLLKHTNRIKKIYLLLETEDIKDVPYLEFLRKKYDVEFEVFNAEDYIHKSLDKDSPNADSFFTDFCFGKLVLPEIVKEEKVLYLDTDTLVVNDISNIWDYDISDVYIAGVKDWGIEKRGNTEELGINGKYINSGVVLYNLKKIRRYDIQKKWFDFINKQELIFPDQDALNFVCSKKELYLPSMYNICDDVTYDIENRKLAKIYHYAGIKEDWVVNLRYSEEWYTVEEEFKNLINNK